jgi:predicted ester cyclase
MGASLTKQLIRRYYEEMWNLWSFDLADELLSPGISFRGSLGTQVRGVQEFKAYMNKVRTAFPDFRNTIDEVVADEWRVAVRLTYDGTHLGELFGVGPTGRRIRYSGAAFFRRAGQRLVDGWVLGDVHDLRAQLGA